MRQTGLTLIEILVALVVIGVTFVALASWQIGNMRIVRSSKEASIATQVANVAMERAVREFVEERSSDPDPLRWDKAAFSCGTPFDNLACEGSYIDIEIDRPVIESERTFYSATYRYDPNHDPADAAGLVAVQVVVTDPYPVTLNQLISCMDVVPPPSFADPRPCPTPPGWQPPAPPGES